MLAQNSPNPCAGETSIEYRVPLTARQAVLELREHLSGRLLRTWPVEAGHHTMTLRLNGLLPGMYHYRLVVDGVPRLHHRLLIAY